MHVLCLVLRFFASSARVLPITHRNSDSRVSTTSSAMESAAQGSSNCSSRGALASVVKRLSGGRAKSSPVTALLQRDEALQRPLPSPKFARECVNT
jgi:hypothetical protein